MARNTAAQVAQTQPEVELTQEIQDSILNAINSVVPNTEGQKGSTEEGATEAEAEVKKTIESIDLSACGSNKSAKIRLLSKEGFSRSDIANFLGIKYQFVRNVLVTKLASDE